MRGNTDLNQGVVPLRTILRNFLNLVDNCEASAKDGHDLYEKEFQELKQFSESLKSDPAYFCKEGEKNVNRKKNRYKDILPYDYTRVILGDYGDVPGSDYINANFIKGASGSSAYIACQGPLPHTVNDFWRMVVECEVQVIVMACNEQESGKHKCENYWVEEEAVEKEFGQVTIWLKKCRQVCPDFLVRTMRIRYVNAKGETEERNVCQFHYSAWPDHGVPTKVRPLLDMVRLIRDCQTSETLPVLVHCSAGCGRTGTICAIDYVWGLLRLGKLTPDFSLFCMVREMRRQRIAMVQTKDQYVLVHRAVKELFEEQLRIIDSHPYANVDHNGLPLDIKSDLEEPTYETVDFQMRDTSRPSSVPPSLPPANQAFKSINAKMEKEVENHNKYQEQEKHELDQSMKNKIHEIKSRPESAQADHEEIQAVSSDIDEKAEKEKEVGEEKRVTKVSPIRNALLRKPSIVKLKAFFEKSKDEKKSGSTQLSRAKSDVSSRFHSFNSFASSFASRGLTKASSSSNSPSSSTAVLNDVEVPVVSAEKTRMKPALLAKPALAVKRSKSLKLTLGDSSSDKFQKNSSSKHQIRKNEEDCKGDVVDSGKSKNSTTTSISLISNNPTKVFVKHVEIPKLQKAVSKSVKAESLKAKTYEQPSSSDNGSSYEIVQVKKPAIPPKMLVSKESLKVPVSSTSPRIKMGVAKEMEDVHQIRNQSFKNIKLKKYDTVTPKSIAAANSGTTLTRSQSHVWQSSKTPMPMRIFSDENIYQSEEKGNSYSKGEGSSKNLNSFSIGLPPPPSSNKKSTTHDSHQRSSSLESSVSFSFKYPKVDLELPREKPVVRKRVPKTNPYTNYSPVVGNTRHSPTPQRSYDYAEIQDKHIGGVQSMNENVPKDLPLLKLSLESQRSRENSSESSSNTGTPRNSLPGTPTRTIDSSYTQILKTNLQELNSNAPSKGNGYMPPRSILKGSLSSTPSESDERLDSRTNPMQNIPHQKSVLTGANQPKLNSIRVTVGVRERRNSFRQAVWKEEQPSNTHNGDVQESPSNNLIFKAVANGNSRSFITPAASAATANGRPGVRNHKDYEPIWPEYRRDGVSLVKNNSNHSMNGASTYMNEIRSHIPISNSRSFDLSSSSDRNNDRLRTQPEFQSRFDEINSLLEELKAPSVHPSIPYQSSSARDRDTSPKFAETKPKLTEGQDDQVVSRAPGLSAAPNLRHNRSLRTQRPQYQQGLSCFAFRKPSSFESITDQLTSEEYAIHSPPGSSRMDQERRFVVEPNESRIDGRGRIANDYVSLRQCHTSSSEPNGTSKLSGFTQSTDMPIPPPRTKNKRRQSVNKEHDRNVHQTNGQPLDAPAFHQGRNNNPHGESEISVNLPEIVRCSSNHTEDSQPSLAVPENRGMQPTSPKSIFKALGIVQAKAANMRSRFNHWTESKEKSNGKRSELLLARDSEQTEYSNNEGGFSQSVVTSANQTTHQQPSKPKHQYL